MNSGVAANTEVTSRFLAFGATPVTKRGASCPIDNRNGGGGMNISGASCRLDNRNGRGGMNDAIVRTRVVCRISTEVWRKTFWRGVKSVFVISTASLLHPTIRGDGNEV